MPTNLTTRIYTFVWSKNSMRNAEIIFRATAPNKWVFDRCTYVGVKMIYDLDDWEFLGELADEIKRLCEENA